MENAGKLKFCWENGWKWKLSIRTVAEVNK